MSSTSSESRRQSMEPVGVEIHDHSLKHIILPRVLPDKFPETDDVHEYLMDKLLDTIKDCDEWIPERAIKAMKEFKRTYDNQTSDVSILKQIQSLEPGETFSMLIENQKCVFLIYVPDHEMNEHETSLVQIATFPSCIIPNEMYKGNFHFTYPAQTLDVKFSELLCSKEFAGQLCRLCSATPPTKRSKIAYPNEVSVWLTAALCQWNDAQTATTDLPTVTKKIRDEAIGNKDNKKRKVALEYWQRSQLYMAMKVLLHLNLTIQMGKDKSDEAKLMYKAVMLRFCTQMSAEYEDPLFCPELNIELMTELLAKMARRIEKLSQFMVEGDMQKFINDVIEEAKVNICKIRERIDGQIKMLEDEFTGKNVLKSLKDLNFEVDIDQQIPTLRAYLDDRKSSRQDDIIHGSNRVPEFMRQKLSREQLPFLDMIEKCRDQEERYINVSETEFWYLYVLQLTDDRFSCANLKKHYNMYAKLSTKFHNGDPLAMSRMLLIRLKLLAVIDRKATTAYPILLEHESGVNTDVFDVLLLPHSIDMKIAYDLQTYFNERNQQARYLSLIGEQSISADSFSVRFCVNNGDFTTEIENIRLAIQVADEQKIKQMQCEWTKQRQEAQDLRLRASVSICTLESSAKSAAATQRHRTNCNKCLYNHKIDNLMIKQYKPTLPDDIDRQNAILFELLIPDEIAILRDVLQMTNKFGQNSTNKLDIKQNWISRELLKTFSKSQSENVFLSSTGLVEPKEYQIGEHDVFTKLMAKNESNCIFHEEGMELNSIMKKDVIKELFTLVVEPGSPYADLQWTMKSHFQNEVLARQSECPQNLSLSEFKEFGSLRADGHRLQIRKLYTMIETEALSFDQSSVLSLILQTIWESGKCGESGYVRETHEDLADSVFATAMIESLDKFVQQHKQNWAHPNKLLAVVFIAVRIFELNENERLLNQLMILLHEIRTILAEWLEMIQNLLHNTIERNQKSEKSLRHSLAIVSIALAATFFVNSKHPYFGKIFEKNPKNGFTSPRMWLLAIIKLYNNALINNNQKNTDEMIFKMLIRIVRNIGIQCETMIRNLIIDSPDDIFEVIKQQWSKAEGGHFKFEFSESCLQSLDFVIEFDKNHVDKVSIDIVTGAFLVNYLSVDQLPHHILSDSNHQRVFGEYVFEVQPHPSNYFTTVQKFNGCTYEFSWWKNSSITTERRVDDDTSEIIEYELIPIKWLIDDIPMFLIEKHSHWWNKEKNVIEFRPQQWNHRNFTKECGIEYKLDLNTNRLTQMKTNRPMLDIKSESYRIILKYLSRLEDPKYIHVFIKSKSDQNYHDIAIIELVRMNLKFIIDTTLANEDGTFEMDSNEFSEMIVSQTQNCKALYGFSNGLLLESEQNVDKKLLIIPHGEVQSTFTYSHVNVNINLKSDLRNPPFHRYHVDIVLNQLKPSNSNFSAWFYLAYLHAITSHGQIEPLTGMSGTERALQILQSSFVWSSAPYDNEVFHTLQLIANLTPHRSLIDNKVQMIEWPKEILEHCAQDSYFFIVEKLIKDSQRLSELHFRSDKFELKKLPNPNLNRCDYFRCLQLRPNLRVDDSFMGHDMDSKPLHSSPINYSKSLKMVSTLYHAKSFKVPKNFKLKEFLTNTINLCGPKYVEYVSKYFVSNAKLRFVDLWISFYEIARTERLNRNHFGLILGLLVHEGDKNIIPFVMILQAVYNRPAPFRNIKPPKTLEYPQPNDLFNIEEVEKILNSCSKRPTNNTNKAFAGYINNRILYETNKLKDFVKDKWPCRKIDFETIDLFEYISIEDAATKLNKRLSTWYENQCLHQFIDDVEGQLKRLVPIVKIRDADLRVAPKPLPVQQLKPKYQIDFAEKMIQRLNVCPELEEAEKVWNMEMISDRSTAEWKIIYENAVRSVDDKHLVDAGLFPRLVPTMILPQIANELTHPDLKAVIGSYALAIARDQHKNRIEDCAQLTNPDPNTDTGITYRNNNEDKDSANGSQEDMDADMDESEMDHEKPANVPEPGQDVANMAHVNWKPFEYPEWLLFEIERDLTIRRIQIEVAKQMINPPGTKHSVMQLNMGEGKTAVIVPILASVLANGEQACQIIVLKSLFATNLNSLRQYLGGMLNRRIYIFPCRRDMPIAECVSKLLDIYEECKKMKGVILTLPEYLLSFQLKIYESVQKENLVAAGTFLTVHKWMNANVRNIMDESDAILQAKYQLIYTVGNQLALDGGINRWIVTQAVLKRVPYHMKSLYDKYEGRKIEYDVSYMRSGQVLHRTDVFTPCRILDEMVYDELSQLLIDDFVKGLLQITFPEMNAAAKDIVRLFLLEKNNNPEMLNGVKGEFTSVHMDILMILNGLLQFNLLKLVLTRRWRVNYGVKMNGLRKMAIPFKAKDVATEMTEFGHPDVAICFTQLSYYYSGLSDEQLQRVFEILNANPNATGIYDKWINGIPKKIIEGSGIQLYSNVNLEDPVQRNEQLFPLLRYNMYVIDFWLSVDVFPREGKTFERKLKCTAWDLCSEHLQHRVTGFSGTNDTKNILPLPVRQNDLQELEQTNEKVRQFLLKRENENYVDLPANVSGVAIIRKLVEHKIRVLLDAGALMLEFSNEQMSKEWLNSEPNCAATVYFDANDILQTIDRNGTVVEFDCSVYRDDLSHCLVYIDDIHTRGTDLKFPLGWKACVTLSGDITRDKTVQACMRMRHLEKGHKISFWASHEADIRIRKICKLKSVSDSILNEHIIKFISKNSQCFEMQNTVHWATAAHNYTKKLAGHKLFEDYLDKAASLINLYESSVDNELATLENLYGNKGQIKLNELITQKFDELAQTFEPHKQITEFIQKNKNDILVKMNSKNTPCSWQSLDEEQEKELEREYEVHRHVERPTLMRPKEPNFDQSLLNYFNGTGNANDSLVHISSGLKNTSLFEPYKNEIDAWSPNLFVTKDFQNVLDTDSECCDDFLRPVWWIGGLKVDNDIQWVILNSFECECLMATFRKSKIATLFMYRPRISRRHDNFLHNDRLKVSGMVKPLSINVDTEIQIGVYGGSMYFKTDAEQQAFCEFLGLIPRPRTIQLEEAFKHAIIKPNGFVPAAYRNLELLKNYVGNCKFNQNPAGLVIKLIIAHRQFMRKESHVASIVDRGIKLQVENVQDEVMDWQEIAQQQKSSKRLARRKRKNSKRPKL